RWVSPVVVLGLAGALVAPSEVSAVPARSRCRPTAFVTNLVANSVSTIDVKTRTKSPKDIAVGPAPTGPVITPDGKTVFVVNGLTVLVWTSDVETSAMAATLVAAGSAPSVVACSPCSTTAFVTNNGSGTVSTIDVKTRTKNPRDIAVGPVPFGVVV